MPKPFDPQTRPEKTIDTDWLTAGVAKARESAAFIKLEIEEIGIAVVGQEGDRVFTYTVTWTAMEKAAWNPLIPAIELVERELESGENTADADI